MGGTSRVTGDGQARIWERLGARFPGPTRQEETELSQTGMRRRGESPANRHREATVTAPLLDSTPNPTIEYAGFRGHRVQNRVIALAEVNDLSRLCSCGINKTLCLQHAKTFDSHTLPPVSKSIR